MESTENANSESHYKLLMLAVVIGLVGVYTRFANFNHSSIVANVILIIGVLIALKAIFAILK